MTITPQTHPSGRPWKRGDLHPDQIAKPGWRFYAMRCGRPSFLRPAAFKRAVDAATRWRKNNPPAKAAMTDERYARHLVAHTRRKATRKGVKCSLTASHVLDLLRAQSWCCAVMGTRFTRDVNAEHYQQLRATIDLVIPDDPAGYADGHVDIICQWANSLKNERTDWHPFAKLAAHMSKRVPEVRALIREELAATWKDPR